MSGLDAAVLAWFIAMAVLAAACMTGPNTSESHVRPWSDRDEG